MEVVDFGWVPPTGESLVRSVKITNTGSRPLTIREARLVGAHAGDFALVGEDFSHVSIYPGSSFSLDLAFSPTGPGVRQAVLHLYCNDPGSPWEVPLSAYVPVSTHRSTQCEPKEVRREIAVAVPLELRATAEAAGPLVVCGRRWVEPEERPREGCEQRLVQELEVLVPVWVTVEGECADSPDPLRAECRFTATHRVRVELPVRIGATANVGARQIVCSV